MNFKTIIQKIFKKIKRIFQKIEKLLKRIEFWFTIIVYPLGYFVYLYLKKYFNMNPLKENTLKWYSGISFAIFAILTIYTIWELIEKRLLHKRQGDRLKIKEKQKDWS